MKKYYILCLLSLLTVVILCSCQKSKKNQTVTPAEIYTAVLQSKTAFFSTEENKYVYLDKFNYFNGSSLESPLKITRFLMLDMDSDKIPEIVLELSNADGVQGTEILHYMNGTVYGYNFAYRALMQIKIDGTFNYSSGAADNGYGKLKFFSKMYEIEVLGCSKSSYNNDVLDISYFISQKRVTEEAYKSFCKEQQTKEDAVSYNFSQANIKREIQS